MQGVTQIRAIFESSLDPSRRRRLAAIGVLQRPHVALVTKRDALARVEAHQDLDLA
jgi:hypothetical protein